MFGFLNSLAPTVIGQQTDKGASGGASSQTAQPQDSRALQQNAQESLKVDESQPVTSIQVRVCPGYRSKVLTFL